MPRISVGDELSSAVLDLRSVVLELGPDLLRAQNEAGPSGNGGPLHRHLRQQERFLVQEGTLRVRRGLIGSQRIGPGQEAVIPAGTPHTFKVEGGGARFISEFRPPWRIAEFFRDLFALYAAGRLDRRGNPRPTDLAQLVERYPDDFFYAPVVPPAVQRALAHGLVRARAGP